MFAKVLTLASALALLSGLASADEYVNGYTRRDGTYVAPHYRSDPDGNFYNNWSTTGNQNPYTGEYGTRRTPPAGYGGYGYGSDPYGN